MTSQTSLLIIVVTWGLLLPLYGVIKLLKRDQFLSRDSTKLRSKPSESERPPGTLLSKLGVLFIFIINIITLFLLLINVLVPSTEQFLAPVKIYLPLWVNIAGCVSFLIGTFWGFYSMIFNPNYTPLYKFPPDQFILATHGPYSLTRHPRYATEALLNVTLFLMTGIWLPLLGLIGWIAMYHQAKAEEEYLVGLAPKEYSEYRKRTRMFLPIPRWKD